MLFLSSLGALFIRIQIYAIFNKTNIILIFLALVNRYFVDSRNTYDEKLKRFLISASLRRLTVHAVQNFNDIGFFSY